MEEYTLTSRGPVACTPEEIESHLAIQAQWESEAPARLRESKKQNRAKLVDEIVVTISTNKTFDGDEVSQNRMVRAIIALEDLGNTTIKWTLADNTTVQVTRAELKEALLLAGTAQSELWEI